MDCLLGIGGSFIVGTPRSIDAVRGSAVEKSANQIGVAAVLTNESRCPRCRSSREALHAHPVVACPRAHPERSRQPTTPHGALGYYGIRRSVSTRGSGPGRRVSAR